MGKAPVAVALILCAAGGACLGSSSPKISGLPDGRLSENIYSNDALGLRFEIPTGWSATTDPKGPVSLDSQNPDGPVNQCSKVLVSLHPSHQIEGGFQSTATLFALDPGCFPDAKFPHSLKATDKMQKFAEKVFHYFSNTPFISTKGVDFLEDHSTGRLIILLGGEKEVNAVEDPPVATSELLHVNLLLGLRESSGYWIAWGAVSDDASKEVLRDTKISFRVDR